MKVRDHTLALTEYKGRWTEASDVACPCRPCYNAHDCGWRDNQGKWTQRMECATRESSGCPSPQPEPAHDLNRVRNCRRCKQHIEKEINE